VHPIGERAKELLPSVLLTLASIIQALSLEVLWSSASDAPHLWSGGPAAVAGWLQVAAVFQTILLIWVYYAHLIMRFRWVPTLRDSLVPFGLGIVQFVLAELLRPDRRHLWCYTLAGLFVFAAWASVAIFRSAQRDPDNDWYFAVVKDSQAARFGPAVLSVGGLLALGVLLQGRGSGGNFGIAAMALANAILLGQIALQRYYWNRSLSLREMAVGQVAPW
jgi:hypothetical protein